MLYLCDEAYCSRCYICVMRHTVHDVTFVWWGTLFTMLPLCDEAYSTHKILLSCAQLMEPYVKHNNPNPHKIVPACTVLWIYGVYTKWFISEKRKAVSVKDIVPKYHNTFMENIQFDPILILLYLNYFVYFTFVFFSGRVEGCHVYFNIALQCYDTRMSPRWWKLGYNYKSTWKCSGIMYGIKYKQSSRNQLLTVIIIIFDHLYKKFQMRPDIQKSAWKIIKVFEQNVLACYSYINTMYVFLRFLKKKNKLSTHFSNYGLRSNFTFLICFWIWEIITSIYWLCVVFHWPFLQISINIFKNRLIHLIKFNCRIELEGLQKLES